MKPKRAIFLRKFGYGIGYFLLFCLFSAAVYWLIIRGLTIQNIVVVGQNIQVRIDETKLPKTLLLFPSEDIRREILKDNPILEDIRFQKKYPHTLIVVPTLRGAAVRLVLPSREVLVDESGIVLADADPSSPVLPRLILDIPVVRIGETIRDLRVSSSLSFVGAVRDTVDIRMITQEDSASLRAKGDKLDILFPQEVDISARVATLQTLLAGFRIKGTLPTFIDLRFDKPVVKF